MTTEVRLAYLAGLFDGEGHISIANAHRHRLTNRATRYFQIQVHLGMQHRPTVEMFAKFFHGRVVTNSSYVFRVAFSCKKASEVIRQLEPFLFTKRRQARLALRFQALRKNPGCKGYTAREHWRDGKLREAMSRLNHRDGLHIRRVLKQQAS